MNDGFGCLHTECVGGGWMVGCWVGAWVVDG